LGMLCRGLPYWAKANLMVSKAPIKLMLEVWITTITRRIIH